MAWRLVLLRECDRLGKQPVSEASTPCSTLLVGRHAGGQSGSSFMAPLVAQVRTISSSRSRLAARQAEQLAPHPLPPNGRVRPARFVGCPIPTSEVCGCFATRYGPRVRRVVLMLGRFWRMAFPEERQQCLFPSSHIELHRLRLDCHGHRRNGGTTRFQHPPAAKCVGQFSGVR